MNSKLELKAWLQPAQNKTKAKEDPKIPREMKQSTTRISYSNKDLRKECTSDYSSLTTSEGVNVWLHVD